jgi:hypothetical protein
MRKRLDAARRIVHMQDQKIRLAETELAQRKAELLDLEDEEKQLHRQIENTESGSSAVIDLLFRRLDQLTRRRVDKQAQIKLAAERLMDARIKGEAATRLEGNVENQLQVEEDRRELLEIIERVSISRGTSFR